MPLTYDSQTIREFREPVLPFDLGNAGPYIRNGNLTAYRGYPYREDLECWCRKLNLRPVFDNSCSNSRGITVMMYAYHRKDWHVFPCGSEFMLVSWEMNNDSERSRAIHDFFIRLKSQYDAIYGEGVW